MKNFKAMSVSALIGIFFFTACQKEEINENKSLAATSTVNDGELIAQNYMKKSYEKYAKVSNEEFVRKADSLREQLLTNKKLSIDKSGEGDIPLGEIFFLYEGTVNSLHAIPLDSSAIVDIYEVSMEIPVIEMENDYFVEIEDYNDFYSDVISVINSEINVTQDQFLAIADFNLNALNSGVATIGIQFFIGQNQTQFPVYLTPGGEVYGAELNGWCGMSNPGIDAAVFVDMYMNGTHGWSSYNCPTSQSPYVVAYAGFETYYPQDAQDLQFDFLAMQNNFWTDNINSCVGDNSDPYNNEYIWNNLYSKALNANTILLPKVRNYFNNQTLQFVGTWIHSHNNGPIPNPNRYSPSDPQYVNEKYYHGGRYIYGWIYCN